MYEKTAINMALLNVYFKLRYYFQWFFRFTIFLKNNHNFQKIILSIRILYFLFQDGLLFTFSKALVNTCETLSSELFLSYGCFVLMKYASVLNMEL